jgi:hypothetical protein
MNMSTRFSLLAVALTAACGGKSPAPVANTGDTPPVAAACELPPEPPQGPPASMCTEMGCTSGYRIGVSPDQGWPAGQYTFEITADGKQQICTGSIPLSDCATQSIRCTGDDLASIEELGCAIDVASQGYGGIAFNGTPCDVRIKISRDGEVLADSSFTPDYRWIEVNGPGCGPRCLQGSDAVTLK